MLQSKEPGLPVEVGDSRAEAEKIQNQPTTSWDSQKEVLKKGWELVKRTQGQSCNTMGNKIMIALDYNQ